MKWERERERERERRSFPGEKKRWKFVSWISNQCGERLGVWGLWDDGKMWSVFLDVKGEEWCCLARKNDHLCSWYFLLPLCPLRKLAHLSRTKTVQHTTPPPSLFVFVQVLRTGKEEEDFQSSGNDSPTNKNRRLTWHSGERRSEQARKIDPNKRSANNVKWASGRWRDEARLERKYIYIASTSCANVASSCVQKRDGAG